MLDKLQRKILRRFSLPLLVTAAPLKIGARTFLTPKFGVDMCEIHEPWMFDLLLRLLPLKQGAFFDVGVNLGQTLLSMKACEPDRPYLGVEPNAQCVAYVEHMIALNRLQCCQIIPIGLSKEMGLRRLQLYSGATCDPSASIVEDFRPDQTLTHTKFVPIFPFAMLEQVVKTSDLGIVKIDVEGAEADVLASMKEALMRHLPWVLVEILPCYRDDNHERIERQNSIEALLDEIGYLKFRIMRGANRRFHGLEGINRIGVHGNLDWCDYLFCPNRDREKLHNILL